MTKSTLPIIFLLVLIVFPAHAQKKQNVTVPAGSAVEDCIPFQERYRFKEFADGKVFFRNGSFAATKLNYNLLISDMEYIQATDTLSIANPLDIILIAFDSDTFCYDNGYLENIREGKIRVAVRQSISLKNILKRDSYGSSSSNSSTDSFSSIETTGKTYKLISNQDRVFEKTVQYFIANTSGSFVPFNKKKVLQLFPEKKELIQEYLKTNKIDFDSKADLLQFAGFLENL
jgi:hypothetical protein